MHTANSTQSPLNPQTIRQAMLTLATRTDLSSQAKLRGIASLQTALNRMEVQANTRLSSARQVK